VAVVLSGNPDPDATWSAVEKIPPPFTPPAECSLKVQRFPAIRWRPNVSAPSPSDCALSFVAMQSRVGVAA
jgi:hypothetical protein